MLYHKIEYPKISRGEGGGGGTTVEHTKLYLTYVLRHIIKTPVPIHFPSKTTLIKKPSHVYQLKSL